MTNECGLPINCFSLLKVDVICVFKVLKNGPGAQALLCDLHIGEFSKTGPH